MGNFKKIYIGAIETQEEAAKLYDRIAILIHGMKVRDLKINITNFRFYLLTTKSIRGLPSVKAIEGVFFLNSKGIIIYFCFIINDIANRLKRILTTRENRFKECLKVRKKSLIKIQKSIFERIWI